MPNIETLQKSSINDIQVVTAGQEGSNILFFHPAGQPPLGMAEHILALASYGRVVAPNIFDLAGSVLRKGEKLTFETIVREFENLDILGKGQIAGIVATSLGGGLAWEMAAKNTHEVPWVTAASPVGWPLRRHLGAWLVELMKMNLQNRKVPKELQTKDPGLKLFLEQFRKDPRGTWGGIRLSMATDSRDQLTSITQPVDLLWGKQDTMMPLESGIKLHEALKNSTLSVVSPYGHMWYNFEAGKVVAPAVTRLAQPQR